MTGGVVMVSFPGTNTEAEAFNALSLSCGCEAGTTWRGAVACGFHREVAGPDGQRLLIGLVCSRRRAAEMLVQEGVREV